MPFIAFYRKEYVEPELNIFDLNNIYHWDEKVIICYCVCYYWNIYDRPFIYESSLHNLFICGEQKIIFYDIQLHFLYLLIKVISKLLELGVYNRTISACFATIVAGWLCCNFMTSL